MKALNAPSNRSNRFEKHPGPGTSLGRRRPLPALRRGVQKLRHERDILKAAALSNSRRPWILLSRRRRALTTARDPPWGALSPRLATHPAARSHHAARSWSLALSATRDCLTAALSPRRATLLGSPPGVAAGSPGAIVHGGLPDSPIACSARCLALRGGETATRRWVAADGGGSVSGCNRARELRDSLRSPGLAPLPVALLSGETATQRWVAADSRPSKSMQSAWCAWPAYPHLDPRTPCRQAPTRLAKAWA
jgi:hypothetical protein